MAAKRPLLAGSNERERRLIFTAQVPFPQHISVVDDVLLRQGDNYDTVSYTSRRVST